MPRELVALDGALEGLTLRLDEGEEWTIGRDPEECNLVIEDAKVSRRHLVLKKSEDGIVLENLSSTNPVKINDETILVPTLLYEGDRLLIGGTTFLYHDESKPFEEPFSEEPIYESTIYTEEGSDALEEGMLDLTPSSRFILKVIAGPNTGAEFSLDMDRDYILGTDALSSDIVFHDLSVSRQHAKLAVADDGTITIEDLGSRNGILVDNKKIEDRTALSPSTLITLGTSTFVIIDKEAPHETILSTVFEPSQSEVKEEAPHLQESPKEEVLVLKKTPFVLPLGPLILVLFFILFIILLGIGAVSLLRTSEVTLEKQDYQSQIQNALQDFPEVKFTFSPHASKILLVGHVANGIRKSELLYKLNALCFIHGIDDNVVDDEAIWQEMNILLSKIPTFQGVTMHSPQPGTFVLSGYLKTNEQMAALKDYMNLNFNYLEGLKYQVMVEEAIQQETASLISDRGFDGVSFEINQGQHILTGYIPAKELSHFQDLLDELANIPGVKSVKSFVVPVAPEQTAVMDLTESGNYHVTGFSKHCDVNINVVINGRILMRGDTLDGMTLTSIQPHTIFFEKDGLKYKLEYNK